jgi:drug/metabolite transporter (DMT)-like permease
MALLVSLFWGANPIAIKVALDDIPPLRLAAYRFLVGGLVIFGWAWTTGRLASFRLEPDERRPLLMLGLLMTVQIASMNIATTMTSAAHVAIILNSYAVHLVVLAHFLIPGDRLTPRRLTGVLIAYAGIVGLFVRDARPGEPTFTGDLIVFFSALVLAERTVYMARAVQTTDAVKINLTQTVVGALAFWVLSLAFEPGATRWTARLVGAIAFQGVVVAGFNFMVNLWLLKRYRPSTLSALFLTQPLFGVLCAAAVTGDALTPALLLASLAVAAGIGLTGR